MSDTASSSKLGALPYGKVVTLIKFNKDKTWGNIKYSGITGWICLAYTETV